MRFYLYYFRRESKIRFHQQSVLSVSPNAMSMSTVPHTKIVHNLPCDWLIYEEMTRMERLAFVKCCTLVSPISIVIFAGPAKLPTDALREVEISRDGKLIKKYFKSLFILF